MRWPAVLHELERRVMHGDHVDNHVRIAREAEGLGYRDGWGAEVRAPDAVAILAAAASVTSRSRLGTGVVRTCVRGPYRMGMSAAALQDHSQGRCIAGLGTSTVRDDLVIGTAECGAQAAG